MNHPPLAGAALTLLLSPLAAMAALGGSAGSVTQDLTALSGAPSRAGQGNVQQAAPQPADVTPQGAGYQVKAFSTKDGTAVREYLYQGKVFGVAWNGPAIPDLQQLFGQVHYASYRNSLQALEKSRSAQVSRRALSVSSSTLVVNAYGKVPRFAGSAYVPQLLPAGFSAADLK
ncbi:hypothetical protein CR207_10420 [Chromobacterium violaceum]|uniref:DUF2844 domain-containing protein n=1 Tax=Chromobacterium violaceum TaxID=536 RepID=UPI000C128E98|nr:DUF2844 domain-containing protein [Chromobacterium violaceum]ATP28773.1 hypothetical protein CRN81_10390 [Chromobacterium violaceum]ATP32684.1 hypothetical protein CR207_10420 [Chromobacterium violaceum]